MKKFQALDASGWSIFFGNRKPKCPHCATDYDISDNEAWDLFNEDDDHEVECPTCDLPFRVISRASWTFSTDEQERDEE